MVLVGYARVSTLPQEPSLQEDALQAAGCERIFGAGRAERSLTGRSSRALEYARAGETLVVWRLDRLGRSLRHLVEVVTDLERHGVGFRSLQESIDTTTPTGRLTFHVFAALAEFERDLIRERTNAGLAAARARGRRGGRPTVVTARKLNAAKTMLAERDQDGRTAHSVTAVAETIGVSRAALYRALNRPADTAADSSAPS